MNSLKSIFAKWALGMASVKFEDYSIKVINAIGNAVGAFLEEAGGEVEAQVKRNSRVDTGQLKSSWTHKVDEAQAEVKVGSPLENAIWEEFGTGEYALEGNGRKGGWTYQDVKGNWHHTTGKKPNRALHKAMTSCMPAPFCRRRW